MPTVYHKPGNTAFVLNMIVGLLVTCCTHAFAQEDVAQVPRELVSDPSYTQYSAMVVQLDLVSNPRTAEFPVSVLAPEPGTILLTGTVPDDRARQSIVSSARRISGLTVQDSMRIGPLERKFGVDMTPEKLEYMTSETLSSLFPEANEKVRTTVTSDGTIVLTGEVNSYEAKVMLSQAVKSQPGCHAVANLLRVTANPDTGKIRISEDGSLQIEAAMLPSIPPARLIDPTGDEAPANTPRTIRSMTNRPIVADDSPEVSPLGVQLVEDAQAAIARTSALATVDLEVTAEGSSICLKGKVPDQKTAEAAATALSNVAGATKVVARTTPVSVQLNLVDTQNRQEAKITVEPRKLMGFIPLGRSTETLPEESRVFRETVKKTLERLCGDKVDDLNVRKAVTGMVIECKVANARDRNFVFKQVDNIVELRSVPYMTVIHVKEL